MDQQAVIRAHRDAAAVRHDAAALREDEHFQGYIRLKTIPDASPELVERVGRYADRLSINASAQRGEVEVAGAGKDAVVIERTISCIHLRLQAAKEARREARVIRSLSGRWPP